MIASFGILAHACGAARFESVASTSEAAAAGVKFDYVVIILMENHSYSEVYGRGMYMTQLADQNVNLTNYQYVDHPREPNYLPLASGQTFNPPSADDGHPVFDPVHVVDRLEWRRLSRR